MMRETDTFSAYHPIINFTFFFGAFVCGMFFMHPVFLVCSVTFAALYYLSIKGRSGFRYLFGMLPLFLFLAGINPLFNTYGEHVLFTYFSGRPYTLEALGYGMTIAAMVVTIFLWFASYNAVMTSDKFMYLFGRFVPSVSLIFTMVLRLIPSYRKKTEQIRGARQGIGLAADAGTISEKVSQGMTILSAMMSWALEGGLVMADSMKSRGYGCSKTRTSYALYRFETRDKAMIGMMAVLLLVIAWCKIRGGAAVFYTPVFFMAGNHYTVMGAAAYALFLAIPTAVNFTEEIIWYILRSKI